MRNVILFVCMTVASATSAQNLVDGFDNCSLWTGKLKQTTGATVVWEDQTGVFNCGYSESFFNSGYLASNPATYQEAFTYRSYSFKAGHKYLIIVHATVIESPGGALKVYASNGFSNGFIDLVSIVSKSLSTIPQEGGHAYRGIFIPTANYSNVVLSMYTVGTVTSGFYQPDGIAYDITILEDPCSGTSASISGLLGGTYLCGGGWIGAESNGGNLMGFLWSTGQTSYSITPPTSGTYSVYVSDVNNCIQYTSVNVQKVANPAMPIVTPSGNVSRCVGQTVTASSTPANAYLWSNGATTQSITVGTAGGYTVKVYNQYGCYTTSDPGFSLTINPYPDKPTILGSHFICPGGSTVQLTAQNYLQPQNYQYSWSPGGQTNYQITTATFGNHVVTATKNGCSTASDPFNVSAGTSVGTITPGGTLCDGTVELYAGSGYGYYWSTGSTSYSAIAYFEGTYSVSYYNYQGCYVYAEMYLAPCDGGGGCTICPRKATDDTDPVTEPNHSFGVYPNPASSQVMVVLSSAAEQDCQVEWIDILGRSRMQGIIETGTKQKLFNLSNLDPGIYLMNIQDNKRNRQRKLVVQR